MFDLWIIEQYDLQSFLKQSVLNVLIGFGGGKPIEDFESLNPYRDASEKLVANTVNTRNEMEAEARKDFKPIEWNLFGAS